MTSPARLPTFAGLLFVAFVGIATPEPASAKLDARALGEISALEDRRSLGDGRLVDFLASKDAETRAAAARAFGRIGRPEGVDPLTRALEDSDAAVRKEAIFALGQIGEERSRDSLNRIAVSNASAEERAEAVLALGKLRGERVAEGILPFLSDPLEAVRADAALALARTSDSVAAVDLRPLLGDPSATVRANAAWAAGRLRAKPLAADVRALLPDADPAVRLAVTKAVGELGDAEAMSGLFALVRDPDWRVRVNVASSLGKMGSEEAYAGLVLLMKDENVHVRAAVAAATKELPYHYKRDDILIPLREDPEPEVRAATMEPLAVGLENEFGAIMEHWTAFGDSSAYVATAAYASFSGASERMGFGSEPNQWKTAASVWLPARLYHPQSSLAERAACAYYAGDFSTTRPRPPLLKALEDPEWVIVASAIHGLGRMVPHDTTEARTHREQTPGVIRDVLEKNPMAGAEIDIRLAAAEALANFDSPVSREVLRDLAANDPEVRVRNEAAGALEKLGEPRPEVKPAGELPGKAEPLDEDFLKAGPGKYTATIVTERGEIVIELLARDAPRTVQSFVRLAEKGFYDGLTFHRVVPNFVIQAGCPIGNGWGHPGYDLRCEYNPLRYERGMVGMAHAGKDTGGSQFFVTHSRQPHLDGRYTIFGRVTSGLEIVDAIRAEDVIETVEIDRKRF